MMIDNGISPAGDVDAERRAGNMAGKTADCGATAGKGETVAALTAAQVGGRLYAMQVDPAGRMDLSSCRGFRATAAAAAKQQKTEQGRAIERIFHHLLYLLGSAVAADTAPGRFGIAVAAET